MKPGRLGLTGGQTRMLPSLLASPNPSRLECSLAVGSSTGRDVSKFFHFGQRVLPRSEAVDRDALAQRLGMKQKRRLTA